MQADVAGATHMCFACSPDNPIGLRLTFADEGDACYARFVPREEHQGWTGVMHGGLIATLLDEAMAQWAWRRGIRAMTAAMDVRFRKAVPIGETVKVQARCTRTRGRMMELAAEVYLADGTVAATATGKFIKIG